MARVLRAVYDLLSPAERRRAAGVLALMLATAVFELLGVGSILPFLTIATDPDVVHRNAALNWAYTALPFRSVTDFLVFTGLAMLVLVVLMNAVSAAAVWVQMRFVYRVGHTISARLMQRYMSQPYAFFLSHHTSELSKHILDDTTRLVTGVLKPGVGLLSRSIVAAAVVLFLLVVEPRIVLLTMAIIGGAYGLVYALIRRRLERKGQHSVEANRARYTTTAEALGGVKEIKTLGRERHFIRRYEDASSRYSRHQAASQVYSQLPRYLIQAVAFGVFMGGFVLLVRSGQDLTAVVPLMGFFGFAAVRLLPAFQEIVAALAQFRFHQHLLFRIHADLLGGQQLPVAAGAADDVESLPFEREIRLEGVRFRYPGAERDVLGGLTLDIPKNSSIALVGATGAGKTTIVDIVLGLLTAQEGALTVDGVRVTAENAAAWRKRVGYVPQDVFLADDTVAANIAYGLGDREIDPASVERAATIAHIHEFIAGELPEGYRTVIGERGVRISGGQRQRLGIARALYHDPDVLVLDEATSDIDNITEAHVTEAIEHLAGRKTVLIVAHRLTTIRGCERIVVLDEGQIVASGTYDELVASSGRFQRLARLAGSGAAG